MVHRLEVDSVYLEFNGRRILSDIYLRCQTGKITGLLGRNGNGKSCLMNVIYGNLKASSQSVRIDDEHVPNAYQRPDLLLNLPQFNFIPKNLSLKRIFSDFNVDYSSLELVFPEFKSKYKTAIKDLSGGQGRLIEIFLLLKKSSRFVMLDEPFSHLSPIHIEVVKELIQQEKANKGFLITDHMFRHIVQICDDLYVLADGKMHLTKDVQELEFLGYTKCL